MYAVYGLDESKEKVERFLGYIPATFFAEFNKPEYWEILILDLGDRNLRVGRLFGRAFFVPATHIKAKREDIFEYMGVDPPPEDRG